MIQNYPTPQDARNFLIDLIGQLEREGKTPTNIRNILKPVRSWFSYKGIEVPGRIKTGRGKLVRLGKEVVPTQEEFRRVLEAANIRTRAGIAMLAFSGIRPQVLGNFSGTDALRVGDFVEMTITNGEVSFSQTPTMFVIRENLSKMGNEYAGFLAEEGCHYLKQYLEWRMRDKQIEYDDKVITLPGEKLTPDSPIFTAIENRYKQFRQEYNSLVQKIRDIADVLDRETPPALNGTVMLMFIEELENRYGFVFPSRLA